MIKNVVSYGVLHHITEGIPVPVTNNGKQGFYNRLPKHTATWTHIHGQSGKGMGSIHQKFARKKVGDTEKRAKH